MKLLNRLIKLVLISTLLSVSALATPPKSPFKVLTYRELILQLSKVERVLSHASDCSFNLTHFRKAVVFSVIDSENRSQAQLIVNETTPIALKSEVYSDGSFIDVYKIGKRGLIIVQHDYDASDSISIKDFGARERRHQRATCTVEY